MHWLVAIGLTATLAAGAARAATPTEVLCSPYVGPWAAVRDGTDAKKMEAVIGSIPNGCPLKAEAQRRLLAVVGSARDGRPAGPTDVSGSGNADYDALDASVKQDWVAAMHWYRVVAARAQRDADEGMPGGGPTHAQFEIGMLYSNGQGVAQNDVEALRWFRLAADGGMAAAQDMVGFAYEQGKGAPQDYVAAMHWYRLAADQGFASAASSIGVFYDKGQGVAVDYAQAKDWYSRAAEKGDVLAENNLGMIYVQGHGVPRDYTLAMHWFRAAADVGVATAQGNVAFMYANGMGVPKDMAAARDWYTKGAAGGDEGSQAWLAKHPL